MFSVYFDEDGGNSYRFEVSAPDTWSFDGVWSTVGHWLKHRTNDDWSEENVEFADQACGRASSMTLLRLFKKAGTPIIPLAEDEEEDFEMLEGKSCVRDIGGSLTRLKAELECPIRDQGRYYRFEGPFDLEEDLRHGVKIRLCNKAFTDRATLEGALTAFTLD